MIYITTTKGTNLRKGRNRVVELSLDDNIVLEGGSKTSNRSSDEEGNTTLDKIVVATREAYALGVKSRFQIVAEVEVACREAVTTQKAMEEAAKVASLAVEAAKEAVQYIADDEF
jgi:hypothetical protein